MLNLDAAAAPLRPDSPEPLWRQTARAIERDIAAAKLPSGSRLPPERDFLTKLAISRVTLRKALHSLVESGVLVSSHGRGWYVAVEGRKEFPPTLESFSETAARLGLTASSDVVKADEAPATLDEAEELSVRARLADFPSRARPPPGRGARGSRRFLLSRHPRS